MSFLSPNQQWQSTEGKPNQCRQSIWVECNTPHICRSPFPPSSELTMYKHTKFYRKKSEWQVSASNIFHAYGILSWFTELKGPVTHWCTTEVMLFIIIHLPSVIWWSWTGSRKHIQISVLNNRTKSGTNSSKVCHLWTVINYTYFFCLRISSDALTSSGDFSTYSW